MTDDPTAGDWQPLADQPVTPEGPSKEAAPPPVAWTPPAYGPPPPPASLPPTPLPPLPPPQSGPWATPGAPTGTDYLESPPRRRRGLGVVIGVVVVVVVLLVAGAITLVGTHSGKGNATSASNPSSAAVTPPSASAPAVPIQPSPSAPSSSAPSIAPAPQASSGPLDSYLLSPSDIGPNALMALIPGGRSVTDQATLDFCNYDYTSEKLRTARVQVEYASRTATASNEFVQYKAGGAASAYAEIQQAVADCPSTYSSDGDQISQIQRDDAMTGLTKEHLAISFADSGTGSDGSAVTQWSSVIYQFDGNYFSGVYVYGTSRSAVRQLGAALAVKAAKHLAEAAAGKPGTGGGPFTDPSAQQGPGAQA